MVNYFIIAHACKLYATFELGNSKLYFKAPDGNLCTGDTTFLDLNKENYKYIVKQSNPSNQPNDYSLNFYDDIQIFGLNTFGVFSELGERIIHPNPIGDIHLSTIIKTINDASSQPNSFYLQICRAPCRGGGGKQRRTLRKKLKKKRKNKKRTYRK